MLKHHHSTPTAPKRVVILGANGFIARDLARHLAESNIPHLSISSAQADLLSPDSVEKLRGLVQPDDALVVTSALTPEKGRDVRTFMKNLTMIQHVAQMFDTAKCAHVIYLSSDAVFDESSSLVSEDTPRVGVGLYGLMHAAREQMLQFALAKPQIPFCVVRPCAVYGAGDTHNSYGPNRFLRLALKDKKITLFGNGEEQRDHIYVRDLSRLIGHCLARKTEGALNAATGRAISFHDVAQQIIRLVPPTVQLECLPRATPITHRHFDVSLRAREFPEFRSTPLEIGLAEMFQEMTSKN
jgi:UDP-glucose 4-epimerase